MIEIWSEAWGASFLEGLQALSEGAYVPTASLLVLLRLGFLECEKIAQNTFENLAHIGRALNTDPFFNDRIPDRMENFNDLAYTTVKLTTIAQQVAQLKSNLEGHQEMVAAV